MPARHPGSSMCPSSSAALWALPSSSRPSTRSRATPSSGPHTSPVAWSIAHANAVLVHGLDDVFAIGALFSLAALVMVAFGVRSDRRSVQEPTVVCDGPDEIRRIGPCDALARARGGIDARARGPRHPTSLCGPWLTTTPVLVTPAPSPEPGLGEPAQDPIVGNGACSNQATARMAWSAVQPGCGGCF